MKIFSNGIRMSSVSDRMVRSANHMNMVMESLVPIKKSARYIFGAGLALGFAMAANGADITVRNANDAGPDSLRQAVIDASSGNVIDFDPTVFTQASHRITLTSELVMDKEITLDARNLPEGLAIVGNHATRLIRVSVNGNLTIRRIAFGEGNGSSLVANGFGGAIFNLGTLRLEDCTVVGNAAANYGGAISSSGSLAVNRSLIYGNTAGSLGGGIYSASSGILTLTNSTLTGNSAASYGGAIYHTSPLTLIHTTITANHADNKGGGIYNDFGTALTLRSSIVAGNSAPVSGDFFGPWSPSAGSITGGDAKLSPLGDFGGPTLTMPPLPNSPALDHAQDEGLETDQRGFSRVLGTASDSGAVEAAVGDYNPTGLTLHARVPTGESGGVFELSTDPDFYPVVSTYAGTGNSGLLDDARLSAQFGFPSAVARDSTGDLFIADSGNNRIRMLDADGNISTIAGSGLFSGLASGPGSVAAFSFPSAIAVGPDDNVYVADTYNHRICKLVRPPADGGEWTVENLAGPNTPGSAGYLDQAGSAARFNFPYGIALDDFGNVYVADSLNHRIRKITPEGGVSTYAGSGTAALTNSTNPLAAMFNTPQAVIVVDGSVFVADTGNHCVRKIAANGALAGEVTTFAGSGSMGNADGTGGSAAFNNPSGLAADTHGVLYVADELNHRIRKITTLGEVTTVAGTGSEGLINGKSNVAEFNAPTGLMVGADQNLIVADRRNHVLRRIIIEDTKMTGLADAGDINGAGLQQVSAVLDAAALGLDPGATYYFRWVSTGGTVLNLGERFVLYELPKVVTEAASHVIPTSAQLNATVDPKSSPTEVVFEYSTDPNLLAPLTVTTFVGSTSSGIAESTSSVPDGNGGLFVSDRVNHRIVRISAAGVTTHFAGSGVAGFADGNGASAKFESPGGLAVDVSGNLFLADTGNHRIRKITPTGEVSTVAGSGVAGFGNGTTEEAKFLYPSGVAVDAAGNLYVADTGNHRIRKIDVAAGIVTTLAGNGTPGFTSDGPPESAQFSSPRGIAVDASGDKLMVADTGNNRIRLISPDGVFAFAGDGSEGFLDGAAANARFFSPTGIALDDDGVTYVTDQGNHRIRRIGTDEIVTTLAGSGISGTIDSPATGAGLYPATATQFNTPSSISRDAAGTLFVTQGGIVRVIARAAEIPTVTVTPDSSGSGNRTVSAMIPQPLLPGASYYFRAIGTNYRGTVTGEPLSLTTTQSAISVFAGESTTAPAIADQQVDAIDFGIAPKGQPVTRYFTISNPGSYFLNVSAVGMPAGYSVSPGNGIISPLDSLTFGITLVATQAGDFSGTVSIASDAPGQASFSFPITGVVLDPPTVVTQTADGIGAGVATLHAMVNPKGSTTTAWFEWSRDPEFDGVTVTTVAGSDSGFAEGSGSVAKFNQPSGIATDAAGNIFIADTQNHRIRKIAPDGSASTLAGSGIAGFADGSAATAQFNEPVGIVLAGNGTLFVTDSKNHRIRAVTQAGDVSTFCGLGTAGFTDGVPAAARFNMPCGLAGDGNGTLYVADRENQRIRKIGPDGTVSTLAGKGTPGSTNGAAGMAEFANPLGIAVDALGNVYVTEAASHAIRKVASDGFTSIFAGSPTNAGSVDAIAANARFSSPRGLALKVDGTLLVADSVNHRIRAVLPDGSVTAYAGSGVSGILDGSGESARFETPVSLATTATGNVIVGDSAHSVIRKIASAQTLVLAASNLSGTDAIPVQTTLSGLAEGTFYFFRVVATNGGGTSTGNRLSIGNSFQIWQSTQFGANAGNPLIAGPAANPAKDGISNLLKYAFHLDPAKPVTNGLPVVALDAGMLTLTYTKDLTAADVACTAEWSADLDAWSPADVSEEILGETGIFRTIRASIPAPPGGKAFLRLNVVLQQP